MKKNRREKMFETMIELLFILKRKDILTVTERGLLLNLLEKEREVSSKKP